MLTLRAAGRAALFVVALVRVRVRVGVRVRVRVRFRVRVRVRVTRRPAVPWRRRFESGRPPPLRSC